MGDSAVTGLCACGCGRQVQSVASQTRRGRRKGEPVMFIKGHNARKMDVDGKRRCSRCGVPRLLDDFGRDRSRADGLDRYCRECRRRASNRAYMPRPRRQRGYSRTGAAERQRRYKLRKRGASEETVAFAEVLLRDPCAYCGSAASTLDHLTPRKRGGTEEWDNLTAACVPCNSRKHARPLLFALLEVDESFFHLDG